MIPYNKVSQFTQIPDYEVLQQLVQSFLNRFDEETINMIPLFINIAEKTILRKLRIPAMEKTVRFTWGNVVASEGLQEGYMYIPSDFVEMKNIWKEGDNRITYEHTSIDSVLASGNTPHNSLEPLSNDDTYFNSDASGDGLGLKSYGQYARAGNRWYFHPKPGTSDVFVMNYYFDPKELSESEGTTKMLELLPDGILYESVAEGYRFLMEEEKATYYNQLAMERVEQVQIQADESDYSSGDIFIING